jgi:hypothetical protein
MSAQRALPDFEIWRAGYAGAQVFVFIAGTTTLASLFTDEALTVPAANPQVLGTLTILGVTYGRLNAPVYTSQAVEWEINGSRTGTIRPPITAMQGIDVSRALVTATGGSNPRDLRDIVANVVNVEDYGVIGTSAATNTVALNAAIGVVAARNGGAVILPEGSIPFTTLTLPAGVILVGQGRGVTMLESTTNDRVIVLGGDRAGLATLTLDGINLIPASVGIFAKGRSETRLYDVEVRRFETGIHCRGGRRSDWRDLYITNCITGAKLHGDLAGLDGGGGDEWTHNAWVGGRIVQCTGIGVELSYEDTFCRQNAFVDVGFETNTGIALKVNGARFTQLRDVWMDGNTTNLSMLDDDNVAKALENTVQNLQWRGGSIRGGAILLRDTLLDVIFEGLNLRGVAFTLTVPKNNILLLDCVEDAAVTIAGSGQYLLRFESIADGASTGLTTDAAATKAWATGELAPGQVVYLEGKAIGNQRNGLNTAAYHFSVSAKRPGSQLPYDTQTANFTVGAIVTGQTSGATARIIADADAGATGTLTLRDIVGVFVDNEIITDSSGGAALVNGVLIPQNVVLTGAVTRIRDFEDVVGWDAAFVANGPEVEMRVTGAAATTIEWTTYASVVST